MTDTASRVKAMLQRAGGAAAAQVAEALGVSRPTAYKYIKVLRKTYGAVVEVRRERISGRGPKSKVYAMAAGRSSRRSK